MTEYDFTDFSSFEFGDFGDQTEAPGQAEISEEPELNVSEEPELNVAVAVVDSDDAVREYLAQLFGQTIQAQSASHLETFVSEEPLVVVLGPSCTELSELAVVEKWPQKYPNVGAILITSADSTQLLHKAIRIGIKDVLSTPIDQPLLKETMGRVSSGLEWASPSRIQSPSAPIESQVDQEEAGKLLSVFSTKGGSGKSVTAVNLAVLLAQSSDKPVVLVDGHLQFGDVEVMLKVQPQHTVVDAVNQIENADASFLMKLLTVHEPSGLLVLPAPRDPGFADQVTGEQMATLLRTMQSFAGHVVVDLPAIFNEVVLSILEESNEIMLVAGLDIPNIKNVKIGLRTLSMLGIPEQRIHLILNRADSKVKLDVAEVERTLGVSTATHIPSDVVVPISVNKGSPVVLSASKSAVARSFEQLASRFLKGAIQTPQSSSRLRFFG